MRNYKLWVVMTLISIASIVGLIFHYEAVVADKELDVEIYETIALDYQITIAMQKIKIEGLKGLLEIALQGKFKFTDF